MLRLFQSIFGKDRGRPGRYPEALVHAGVERAVDATDPRIRAIPGYRRKLEPAVVHAIDHVVALVGALPPPLDLGGSYHSDPSLRFVFTSPANMREMVSADRAVTDFLETIAGRTMPNVVSLLLMQLERRNVFGVETEGDLLRRDVPQSTVGFSGRHFVDPAETSELACRQHERRAFDRLLGIALGHIGSAAKERASLATERTLLRRKLKVLESASWTFETGDATQEIAPASIETKLEEIERELCALGGHSGTLQQNLEQVIEVLDGAERQLWAEPQRVVVDRMGIERDQPSDEASAITFVELHDAVGRTAVALPVAIPRGAVQPRGDPIAEARRYLC